MSEPIEASMSIDEINRRIDALSERAKARMAQCDPTFSTAMGGAPIDFMTQDERAELHRLTLQLPSFAELRAQARARIAERIAARRRGRDTAQPAQGQ